MARMNIYLTTAKRVYKYAYPVLASLFENNMDSQIHVYIVSEDLETSDIVEEQKLANEYGGEIHILHFDEEMARTKITTAGTDHWPLGTLGCYWLFHELLPADVDRIMAIESDAIVTGSVREFYDMTFDGNYAICPDAEHKPVAHQELMKKIGGDLLTFVPSVYDVEAIRSDFTIDDILEADKVGVQGLGHSQQELTFGVLFKGRIKFIPAPDICVEENSASLERFGIDYIGKCEQTEKIIHFSSTGAGEKPWRPVYVMPGYEIWWEYARKSPYYDFYIESQIAWQKERDKEKLVAERNLTFRNVLAMLLVLFVIIIAVVGTVFDIHGAWWIAVVIGALLASADITWVVRFILMKMGK